MSLAKETFAPMTARATVAIRAFRVVALPLGLLASAACAVGSSYDGNLPAESDAPTMPPDAGESQRAPTATNATASAPADAGTNDSGSGANASEASPVANGPGADAGTSGKGTSGTGKPDAGSSACSVYARPSEPALCDACAKHACQANGCYGGYYCDQVHLRCVAPVPGC